MNTSILVFPLLVFYFAPANWTKTERALLSLNVACHITDYRQTRWALDHGYREQNPLYGSHPSDEKLLLGKSLALGVTFVLSNKQQQDRSLLLLAAALPCLVVTKRNYELTGRGIE